MYFGPKLFSSEVHLIWVSFFEEEHVSLTNNLLSNSPPKNLRHNTIFFTKTFCNWRSSNIFKILILCHIWHFSQWSDDVTSVVAHLSSASSLAWNGCRKDTAHAPALPPKRQHFFSSKINDACLHVCLKLPQLKNAHLPPISHQRRCLFSVFQRPISEVKPPIFCVRNFDVFQSSH